MAANFIGLIVQVTLSNPPGEKVRGTVKDVGAGQQLTLASGTTTPTHTASGLQILNCPQPALSLLENTILLLPSPQQMFSSSTLKSEIQHCLW